jgi:hypothetical protein
MARGTYYVHGDAQTISTAITILEVAAPSTAILRIKEAWVEQSSSTTSAMARIRILRKSGTITGTASPPTPAPVGAEAASGATVKWVATGEGTDGTVILERTFNILNGFYWLPVPEMYIVVPPSGIIALKFPAAPTSASYSFGFGYEELG